MAGRRCLEVTVGSTSGLKESRSSAKDDPYAVIRLGSVSHTTQVTGAPGMRPVWNHRFSFILPERSENDPEFLEVEIWDGEQVLGEKQLGLCRVNLKDVYNKGFMETLQSVHRKSGKLLGHLRLHLSLLVEEPSPNLPWNHSRKEQILPFNKAATQTNSLVNFGSAMLPPVSRSSWKNDSKPQEPFRSWGAEGHLQGLNQGSSSGMVSVGGLLEHIQRALKSQGQLKGLSEQQREVKQEWSWQPEGELRSNLVQIKQQAREVQEHYEPDQVQCTQSLPAVEEEKRQTWTFAPPTAKHESSGKGNVQQELEFDILKKGEQPPLPRAAIPPPSTQLKIPKPPPLDLSVLSTSSASELSPNSPAALFQSPSFAGLVSPALWSSLAPTPTPLFPPVSSRGNPLPSSSRRTNQDTPKWWEEVRAVPDPSQWPRALAKHEEKREPDYSLSVGVQKSDEKGKDAGGVEKAGRGAGLQRSASSPLSIGGKKSAFKEISNKAPPVDSNSPNRKRASSEELVIDFDMSTPPGGTLPPDSIFWKEKRSRFTS